MINPMELSTVLTTFCFGGKGWYLKQPQTTILPGITVKTIVKSRFSLHIPHQSWDMGWELK